MLGFSLVVFSALCHALWNVLLKQSSDKYTFSFLMHSVNISFFTIIFPIFFRNYMVFDINAIMFGCMGGAFFALYHICISTAYRYSDVSTVYPITTSSPLFIVIWAALLMGERLSFYGYMGILLTVGGVLVLNEVRGSHLKLSKGTIFAFLAAFAYSFGALADKWGVDGSSVINYTYWLCFFMTFFLGMFVVRRKTFKEEFKRVEKKYVIIGGLIIFLSFVTYRYGLTYMAVSYAAALRQVNSIFVLLISVLIFHETLTSNKIVGTVIILLGVVLIRFGM